MAVSGRKIIRYIVVERVCDSPRDFYMVRTGGESGSAWCATGSTLPQALEALAQDIRDQALIRYDDDVRSLERPMIGRIE